MAKTVSRRNKGQLTVTQFMRNKLATPPKKPKPQNPPVNEDDHMGTSDSDTEVVFDRVIPPEQQLPLWDEVKKELKVKEIPTPGNESCKFFAMDGIKRKAEPEEMTTTKRSHLIEAAHFREGTYEYLGDTVEDLVDSKSLNLDTLSKLCLNKPAEDKRTTIDQIREHSQIAGAVSCAVYQPRQYWAGEPETKAAVIWFREPIFVFDVMEDQRTAIYMYIIERVDPTDVNSGETVRDHLITLTQFQQIMDLFMQHKVIPLMLALHHIMTGRDFYGHYTAVRIDKPSAYARWTKKTRTTPNMTERLARVLTLMGQHVPARTHRGTSSLPIAPPSDAESEYRPSDDPKPSSPTSTKIDILIHSLSTTAHSLQEPLSQSEPAPHAEAATDKALHDDTDHDDSANEFDNSGTRGKHATQPQGAERSTDRRTNDTHDDATVPAATHRTIDEEHTSTTRDREEADPQDPTANELQSPRHDEPQQKTTANAVRRSLQWSNAANADTNAASEDSTQEPDIGVTERELEALLLHLKVKGRASSSQARTLDRVNRANMQAYSKWKREDPLETHRIKLAGVTSISTACTTLQHDTIPLTELLRALPYAIAVFAQIDDKVLISLGKGMICLGRRQMLTRLLQTKLTDSARTVCTDWLNALETDLAPDMQWTLAQNEDRWKRLRFHCRHGVPARDVPGVEEVDRCRTLLAP